MVNPPRRCNTVQSFHLSVRILHAVGNFRLYVCRSVWMARKSPSFSLSLARSYSLALIRVLQRPECMAMNPDDTTSAFPHPLCSKKNPREETTWQLPYKKKSEWIWNLRSGSSKKRISKFCDEITRLKAGRWDLLQNTICQFLWQAKVFERVSKKASPSLQSEQMAETVRWNSV